MLVSDYGAVMSLPTRVGAKCIFWLITWVLWRWLSRPFWCHLIWSKVGFSTACMMLDRHIWSWLSTFHLIWKFLCLSFLHLILGQRLDEMIKLRIVEFYTEHSDLCSPQLCEISFHFCFRWKREMETHAQATWISISPPSIEYILEPNHKSCTQRTRMKPHTNNIPKEFTTSKRDRELPSPEVLSRAFQPMLWLQLVFKFAESAR